MSKWKSGGAGMRIIIEDMNEKTIMTINNLDLSRDVYKYTPEAMKVEHDKNYLVFDRLNHDAIVLKPCKNSRDFIIEHISQGHIDRINHHSSLDVEIRLEQIIGRYFSNTFPFISQKKIFSFFNKVLDTGEAMEFRELKFIDDMLISSYRHKIYPSNGRIYHIGYYEDDLVLWHYIGKDFFIKSPRPYIIIEGNKIKAANESFLDLFEIKKGDRIDLNRIRLLNSSLEELKFKLNNVLNRKSLFEVFDFSIVSDKRNVYFRAYATPDSYDSSPAVKIFLKNISREKEYERNYKYLRDTLRLIKKNEIAGLFKEGNSSGDILLDNESVLHKSIADNLNDSNKDVYYEEDSNYHEESILEGSHFNKPNSIRNESYSKFKSNNDRKSKSNNDLKFKSNNDLKFNLDNNTSYTKGIYNILDLNDDFNENIRITDFIVDGEKKEFENELNRFSKDYGFISTNFKIKTAKNNEKYIKCVIKGQFDNEGNNINYIGFLKDDTERLSDEIRLKGNISKIDELLIEILDAIRDLEKSSKYKGFLLDNTYNLVGSVLDLFILSIDKSFKSRNLDRNLIYNMMREINVLKLLEKYIGRDWDLLNLNLNQYLEDIAEFFNTDYDLKCSIESEAEDISLDIGTVSYLGLMVQDILYNAYNENNGEDLEIHIDLNKEEKATNDSQRKGEVISLYFAMKNNISDDKGLFEYLDKKKENHQYLFEYLADVLDFKLIINKDNLVISFPVVNEEILFIRENEES